MAAHWESILSSRSHRIVSSHPTLAPRNHCFPQVLKAPWPRVGVHSKKNEHPFCFIPARLVMLVKSLQNQ